MQTRTHTRKPGSRRKASTTIRFPGTATPPMACPFELSSHGFEIDLAEVAGLRCLRGPLAGRSHLLTFASGDELTIDRWEAQDLLGMMAFYGLRLPDPAPAA